MDSPSRRYGYVMVASALAAAAVSLGGCRTALTTAAYLIKGTNIDAEYDGLSEKKVAVVCRPMIDLEYSNSNAAKDLAKQVGILLGQNVSEIVVISQDKVLEFTDENLWDEYTQVGDALGAEIVLAIDLQSFKIYQGQTLYQGRAAAAICVYDCTNGGAIVFEKQLPQAIYPPNALVPTSEKPEAEFRREFVRVLADQIGRYFYPHDAHADYALDTAVLD